jgi:hypothetical protein
MPRSTVARIDLDALRRNYRLAQARAGGARAMAVVKADGYGHGIVNVARALAGEVEKLPWPVLRKRWQSGAPASGSLSCCFKVCMPPKICVTARSMVLNLLSIARVNLTGWRRALNPGSG